MKKTPPPSRTAPQFVIRFPDEEMRDRIREEAEKNNRSMNAEIIARLGQSLRLPGMIDNISDAYKAVEAEIDQKDAMLERLAKLSEAQKIVSDQQQHIIDQLLKALPLIPDDDTQKAVSKKTPT